MALKKACSCSGITNLRRAEFSQQLLSHYHTKQKLVSVEEKKKKKANVKEKGSSNSVEKKRKLCYPAQVGAAPGRASQYPARESFSLRSHRVTSSRSSEAGLLVWIICEGSPAPTALSSAPPCSGDGIHPALCHTAPPGQLSTSRWDAN